MGRFKKGDPRPPGAGRKKGQKAKYQLPSVQEVLHKRGIDPLEKLLDIAADPNTPVEEKRKIYTDVQSYTRPKPRQEFEISPSASPEVPESVAPTAQLLSLVKGGQPEQKEVPPVPTDKTAKNGD